MQITVIRKSDNSVITRIFEDEEGIKKLMIIGRLQANPKTKNLYDYAGCPWPEGYMDKEHCYVFNHEDIDLLYYLGMQDIEEFNFRFKLDEAIEKIESEGYKHAKSKHKCDNN